MTLSDDFARVRREIGTGFGGAEVAVAEAVAALDRIKEALSDQEIIRAFRKLYYEKGWKRETWAKTWWMGIPLLKNPFDLWVLQETIFDVKPDLIIETGTCFGGSAAFLAHVLDGIGHGELVTIDIEPAAGTSDHPRVTYLRGSSTDPDLVRNLTERAKGIHAKGGRVLVNLDSDHSEAHVSAELRCYAPLVSPGGYLIVEDTYPGPGPAEAVAAFLTSEEGKGFVIDREKEKHLMSFNAGGWLKRV